MFEVAMNATDTVCDRPYRDEGHVLVICAAVLGTSALLAVAMRVYVAIRQNSFGYDDTFACLAACMSVPNSIGLATSAMLGLGRDIWTLTPHEITKVLKVGSPISRVSEVYLTCRLFTSVKTSISGARASRNSAFCTFSFGFSLLRVQGNGAVSE